MTSEPAQPRKLPPGVSVRHPALYFIGEDLERAFGTPRYREVLAEYQKLLR